MQDRLKRLRFRAWHRGTREADYMIGGFFDRYSPGWDEAEVEWFEAVVEEDDVDIMAWALGTGHPPAHLDRPAWIAATVVRISSPRLGGACSADSVASRSALTRIDGPARS